MTTDISDQLLAKGNREIVTDYYVPNNIESDKKNLRFKVFIRLNAKGIKFTKVSFMHLFFSIEDYSSPF